MYVFTACNLFTNIMELRLLINRLFFLSVKNLDDENCRLQEMLSDLTRFWQSDKGPNIHRSTRMNR